MKKIILGFGLLSFHMFSFAQVGLDSIIVEKYYVSDAADAAGSVGTLPVGSVTYRVFVDLATGYEFQNIYGNTDINNSPLHVLNISTSTTFFNNEDYGTSEATIGSTNLKKNSVALDSWFSVGGAASGQMGVLKSEDDGVANLVHTGRSGVSAGMLTNSVTAVGIPLTTQDGMIAGTPQAVTKVGVLDYTMFDNVSQAGGVFSTSDGTIASLNGSVGPTPTNRVLIGQFTTDGVFHFELNMQIRLTGSNPAVIETYVASNPQVGEFTMPSLTYTSPVSTIPNVLPTAAITAPAISATYNVGAIVTFAATATDSDGTIDSVSFFVDGIKIGNDVSSPYTHTFVSTLGTHTLTVEATDNDGGKTTSASQTILVNAVVGVLPTVAITAPISGATYTVGETVSIAATAADADGTIDSVSFFVNGVKIGNDVSSPYTYTFVSTVGTHTLTAEATDNNGGKTTSAGKIIVVSDTSIGINEINATNSILSVYPNPSSDYITIDIHSSENGVASYSVYTILGNLIFSKNIGMINGIYQERFDVSSLTKGEYILEVIFNGIASTKKVVIN